jgi:hypothetical protein
MSGTPAGATPIGKNFYLFKAISSTPECLISAHGGHDREQHFEVPAGVTVHFYALHGFVLNDPGTALLNAQITPKESITGPASCHDYTLSKYQGRHNRGGRETYASIATQVQNTAQARSAAQAKYVQAAASAKTPDFKLDLLASNVTTHKEINIVTVRNRFGASDQLLSTLINEVRAAYPSIKIFHCSFCRSSMNFDAGLAHSANYPADRFF